MRKVYREQFNITAKRGGYMWCSATYDDVNDAIRRWKSLSEDQRNSTGITRTEVYRYLDDEGFFLKEETLTSFISLAVVLNARDRKKYLSK